MNGSAPATRHQGLLPVSPGVVVLAREYRSAGASTPDVAVEGAATSGPTRVCPKCTERPIDRDDRCSPCLKARVVLAEELADRRAVLAATPETRARFKACLTLVETARRPATDDDALFLTDAWKAIAAAETTDTASSPVSLPPAAEATQGGTN